MANELPMGWADHFPKTDAEVRVWRQYTSIVALANRVLAVATTRVEGSWSAYCDAVEGQNHHREAELVLRFGSKMDEQVARLLFPIFEGVPYAL